MSDICTVCGGIVRKPRTYVKGRLIHSTERACIDHLKNQLDEVRSLLARFGRADIAVEYDADDMHAIAENVVAYDAVKQEARRLAEED